MDKQDIITIGIVSDGKEHSINTYRYEYRSLMTLIQDKLSPDHFGECGGMGRCATCLVQLSNVWGIDGMDRNESSTLSKHGIIDPLIRLSCQLLVDVALHNTSLTIVDSY